MVSDLIPLGSEPPEKHFENSLNYNLLWRRLVALSNLSVSQGHKSSVIDKKNDQVSLNSLRMGKEEWPRGVFLATRFCTMDSDGCQAQMKAGRRDLEIRASARGQTA
jgi:hypothetical protein